MLRTARHPAVYAVRRLIVARENCKTGAIDESPSLTVLLESCPVSSLSRTFALLDLFTPEKMVWTAEAMIDRCGYTRPTGYRYIRELVETGFLIRYGDGSYSLGSRAIELDLLIRQADPLLSAGLPVIKDLVERTGFDVTLTRLYGERIITVHQESGSERLPLSFGRGRQLPILRGAPSKIIVAHLPRGRLKRIYEADPQEAAASGCGDDWGQFRSCMLAIRRAGYALTQGELQNGLAGLAAPIFGVEGEILGSIAAAVTQQRFMLTQVDRLIDMIKVGAARITEKVASANEPPLRSEFGEPNGGPL